MAVAVGGDHGISPIARHGGAREVPRPGIQLLIAHALDDDLIETDRGNEQTRHWRAYRGDLCAGTEIDEASFANRALRLCAFPRCASLTAGERASSVGGAGEQKQRSTDEVEHRSNATAHGA